MANNEWGTPTKYIASARKVMGSIDLDPASNDAAQQVIMAKKFFTIKNGYKTFTSRWAGNVWLNPPYGRGDAEPFVYKLVNSSDVLSAIVLTNHVTDVNWWVNTIGLKCSAVCLPDHRIAFINPDTGLPERGNDRAQLFTYLGGNPAAFVAEFSQYGLCSLPWRVA